MQASVLHLPSLTPFISWRRLLLVLLLFVLRSSYAETSIVVPMKADRWLSKGSATFTADEHFPHGLLEVGRGSFEVKDLVFTDGTIEFDMHMPDRGILGMLLRAQDRGNAEALYFRPQKDCAVSPDCMQYMPLDHGAFEWDLFPEYQSAAPINSLAWNHFKVVVMGRTMRVHVNHSSQPTLTVDHMEGGALPGAIIFGGPAKYANLVITPTRPATVAPQTVIKPNDGFLRQWQMSAAAVLPSELDTKLNVPTGVQPPYASMPAAGAGWKNVTAQTKGLVNFSRELGSAKDASVISVAWIKTNLVSDKPQTKTVRIGWVREIWVYVNGALVYTGRNLGDLPAAQVADQRISLENGTFQLQLNQGNNEIAIALDDNLPGNAQHFGWGVEVKLDDTAGTSLAPKN